MSKSEAPASDPFEQAETALRDGDAGRCAAVLDGLPAPESPRDRLRVAELRALSSAVGGPPSRDLSAFNGVKRLCWGLPAEDGAAIRPLLAESLARGLSREDLRAAFPELGLADVAVWNALDTPAEAARLWLESPARALALSCDAATNPTAPAATGWNVTRLLAAAGLDARTEPVQDGDVFLDASPSHLEGTDNIPRWLADLDNGESVLQTAALVARLLKASDEGKEFSVEGVRRPLRDDLAGHLALLFNEGAGELARLEHAAEVERRLFGHFMGLFGETAKPRLALSLVRWSIFIMLRSPLLGRDLEMWWASGATPHRELPPAWAEVIPNRSSWTAYWLDRALVRHYDSDAPLQIHAPPAPVLARLRRRATQIWAPHRIGVEPLDLVDGARRVLTQQTDRFLSRPGVTIVEEVLARCRERGIGSLPRWLPVAAFRETKTLSDASRAAILAMLRTPEARGLNPRDYGLLALPVFGLLSPDEQAALPRRVQGDDEWTTRLLREIADSALGLGLAGRAIAVDVVKALLDLMATSAHGEKLRIDAASRAASLLVRKELATEKALFAQFREAAERAPFSRHPGLRTQLLRYGIDLREKRAG